MFMWFLINLCSVCLWWPRSLWLKWTQLNYRLSLQKPTLAWLLLESKEWGDVREGGGRVRDHLGLNRAPGDVLFKRNLRLTLVLLLRGSQQTQVLARHGFCCRPRFLQVVARSLGAHNCGLWVITNPPTSPFRGRWTPRTRIQYWIPYIWDALQARLYSRAPWGDIHLVFRCF